MRLQIPKTKTSRKAALVVTVDEIREEAKAKKILDAIEARVTAGIAHGEKEEGPLTVVRYVKTWLEERRKRGYEDVKTDEGRLKHAAPLGHLVLASVRPRHIRDLVWSLSAKVGTVKTDMAPRTVRHVYGTLHTMFADALAEELIEADPCVLKRGELPKTRDKDPTWRAGAVFTRDEVERIISDDRIPDDRRVLDALLFLAGLRFGESSALRVCDYDATMKPLGRIRLTQSYSTKKRKVAEDGAATRDPGSPHAGEDPRAMEAARMAGDDGTTAARGRYASVGHALRRGQQAQDRAPRLERRPAAEGRGSVALL